MNCNGESLLFYWACGKHWRWRKFCATDLPDDNWSNTRFWAESERFEKSLLNESNVNGRSVVYLVTVADSNLAWHSSRVSSAETREHSQAWAACWRCAHRLTSEVVTPYFLYGNHASFFSLAQGEQVSFLKLALQKTRSNSYLFVARGLKSLIKDERNDAWYEFPRPFAFPGNMGEHKARNYLLPGGVSRYGRAAMYRRKALYKRKKTTVKKDEPKADRFKTKQVRGDKNGGTRKVPVVRRVRKQPSACTMPSGMCMLWMNVPHSCNGVLFRLQTRFYPTEDVPRPLKNRKVNRPTRLRSSIKPGSVLILLAGVHRGKVWTQAIRSVRVGSITCA